MMDILAISPPDTFPAETQWIARLLDAGLTRYHLRKPDWSAATLAAFLQAVPPGCRSRLVLHQHHALVQAHALGGWHVKDHADARPPLPPDTGSRPAAKPVVSRSLHRISALVADTQGWDAVLLSPVFPSFSKPGYQAPWTESELVQSLREFRSTRLYALGGIDATRARRCHDWGFDGVVLHGALWRAADPLTAFETIRGALS